MLLVLLLRFLLASNFAAASSVSLIYCVFLAKFSSAMLSICEGQITPQIVYGIFVILKSHDFFLCFLVILVIYSNHLCDFEAISQ